jgi:hypothetical protein
MARGLWRVVWRTRTGRVIRSAEMSERQARKQVALCKRTDPKLKPRAVNGDTPDAWEWTGDKRRTQLKLRRVQPAKKPRKARVA